LRKGEAVAFLVPTKRTLEKKIARTLELVSQRQVEQLDSVETRIIGLERAVAELASRIPTADEVKDWRQVAALSRVVLGEWRTLQGLPAKRPITGLETRLKETHFSGSQRRPVEAAPTGSGQFPCKNVAPGVWLDSGRIA
jgi:hypothetical protein